MIKILILFIALGLGLIFSAKNDLDNYLGSSSEPVAEELADRADIVMYSLTTCGFCKKKAREFKKMNLPFSEYYIDKDSKYMDELNSKLAAAGFPPRGYGTPIIEVNGVMMPNNPSMKKILKVLEKG